MLENNDPETKEWRRMMKAYERGRLTRLRMYNWCI